MKTIIVENAKSFLASVLFPGSTAKSRTPALAVHTPLAAEDFPHLDHEAAGVLSAYIIHDVVPLHDDNPMDCRVQVYFHFSGEPDEGFDTQYSIVLGVHELAIVNVLSAMHENSGGGVPIVFIDSNTHDVEQASEVIDPTKISFALVVPHYKSEEAIEISKKLSEIFNPDFSVARSSKPWYDAEDEQEVSPILRAVQGRLLPILMGLSRGDVAYIKELVRFESELNSINSSIDEDDEDAVYDRELLSVLVHTAKAVYGQAVLCNPSLQTVESLAENVGPFEYRPDIDVAFQQITSGAEFNGIFQNVQKDFVVEKSENEIKREKNIEIWESSLGTDWPENMKEIGAYLSTLDDYETYVSLLHEDFNDVERINECIQQFGLGKIFTALMLTISAYALKRVEILAKDNDAALPAVLILNEWVNVSHDEFVWEIPALAKSLALYDTKTAVDVLTMYYQPRKNPNEAFHLIALLHTLGHHFAEDPEWDEYDFSMLESDMASLGINTPKFKEFSKWFLEYIDVLLESFGEEEDDEDDDEDDSNGACYTLQATRKVMEETEDIEKVAAFAALTLPVMADILAQKNPDLDEGGEEWSEFRLEYINNFLTNVAENFGGRIKLVAR